MFRGRLGVTIGGQNPQGLPLRSAHQACQKIKRVLSGPLKIIEHEQGARWPSYIAQEARDCVEDQPLLLFGGQ